MEENQDAFVFNDEPDNGNQTQQEEGSIFDNQNQNDDDNQNGDDNNQGGNDDNEEPGDYIDRLLQSKGIDRKNIEITEEDGTVNSVNFDDLSDEDKLNLLSEDEVIEDENPITDNDLELLNYFRQNRINSLQEFADGIAKNAIDQYIASQQTESITYLDNYSDEDVIAYDLIRKFGDDMSDDEIDAEVQRLKEDEDAFTKKVELLRTYYKNEADAQQKLYEDNYVAQRQADIENFTQAYNEAAYNLDTIQGIDLEDHDKQELLDFVLTKDQFGNTEFSKALNDPNAVLQMAWFLLNGEAAAEATRNYFASLLSQQRAQSASRLPRAVSRTNTNTNTNKNKQTNTFKF